MNKQFLIKIRYLFIPYVLIAIGFIGLATFLDWYFIIKTGLIDMSELVVVLIGLGLSIVSFWFMFWPRVKAIAPKANYVFTGSLLVCFPNMCAQQYLNTVTGKVTVIDSVSQISTLPITHYYTIKKYYADKNHVCSNAYCNISGRGGSYYNIHLYMLIPLIENVGDTNKRSCDAWLGYEYVNAYDNNKLSDQQKDTLWKKFMDSSWANFDNRSFSGYTYFEKMRHTEDRPQYEEALKSSTKFLPKGILLEGFNSSFDNRSGDSLLWLIVTFTGLVFLMFIAITTTPIDEGKFMAWKNRRHNDNF